MVDLIDVAADAGQQWDGWKSIPDLGGRMKWVRERNEISLVEMATYLQYDKNHIDKQGNPMQVRAVGENPTIPTRTAQNRLMYSPEEAK